MRNISSVPLWELTDVMLLLNMVPNNNNNNNKRCMSIHLMDIFNLCIKKAEKREKEAKI